jgi:BT1 family
LIGAGIFATTLSQSSNLALPLRNMLAEQLKEPLSAVSSFFAIAAISWYIKIVVGLLSDSIPLFGTRRRHYLLVSATLAGAFWFLSGFITHSYLALNYDCHGSNARCSQHSSRRTARRGWTTA